MSEHGDHRGDGSGDGRSFSFLASAGGSPPAPFAGDGEGSPPARDGFDWQSYFSPSGGGRPGEGEEWRDVLEAVRRHKLWIAAAFVLCTALGLGAASYFPDVYQAEAKVWVDSSFPEETGSGGYELLNGEGWTAFFQSSRVLLPATRSLNANLRILSPDRPDSALTADFSLLEGETRPGLYRLVAGSGDHYRLYRARWTLPGPLGVLERVTPLPPETLVERGELDGTVGTSLGFAWRPDLRRVREAGAVRFRVVTPREAARGLRDGLEVDYSSETGLMTLRFQDSDAERAAATLNTLLDHFTDEAHRVTEGKISRVVENLERRVADARERLDEARAAMNEEVAGDVRAALSRPGEAEDGGPEVGALSDDYLRRRTEAREIQAELDILESARSRVEAGDSVQVARLQSVASDAWPDALVGVLTELDSLRAQRRKLLQTFTERHPDVKELDERIARVRGETLPPLLEEGREILRARHAALTERIQAERRELQEQASENIRGRELWDAYARAETLHADLAGRLQDARLARSARLPAFEVLDRAAPPPVPFHSRDRQILALAALGGLALGLGGALLRNRMDDRVRDPDALRERLGLPFLGVVPTISSSTASRRSSNEAILSSFRSVRNRIEGMAERPGGVVSVTSPGVGDGKSTVATNLAVSYANAGHRTILLDADLFRGCLHGIFGLPRSPGLTDGLLGRASPEEMIHHVDVPGLAVVPAGRPSPDGANVLGDDRTDRLISRLTEMADVVVMDTSPLSAGSESAVLAEKSDRTVLVLRAEHTDLRQAEIQLRMLFAHRIPLVGAILNDVSRSAPYYVYYSAEEYYRTPEPAPSAEGRELTAASG